jgi:DNA helicase II / ATP-dependent DNA helicase PcrA
MNLNREQRDAVDCDGNVVVTACPGSGKTRVLTARVIRGVDTLGSRRERVAALTFTNRAADEIRARLDQEGVPTDCLWSGTIHSFALEWILRPYAPYAEPIRRGFAVADEYYCERLLREARRQFGMDQYAEINTAHQRDGRIVNASHAAEEALEFYKEELRRSKLIDYDEVLHLAYRLLAENAEIAANLGAIFRLFCVDEVQDIQDLQYAILSEIYRASRVRPELFFVGDADQSIYESLGALTKSPEEIAAEFGVEQMQHFELLGNYRSTQRIIDYCRLFRPDVARSDSRIENPDEHGLISFQNQTVLRDNLSAHIARLVRAALDEGISEDEICIVAPQWGHVRSLARQLVEALPDVRFDAPGLSPLYSVRDSVWYKLARLFLTQPVPVRIRSRIRCANEVLIDLEFLLGSDAPEPIGSARRLLRLVNQLESAETDGIPYLRDVFTQFLQNCSIEIDAHQALRESFDLFFEKAEGRLEDASGGMPASIDSFRNIFSYPSGVVVNTCHGVKGEEFDTVIAFGLLRGFVPHWEVIIHGTRAEAEQRESKLLYVVASRAKRQLLLIAESGRRTRTGNSYQTCSLLEETTFDYDEAFDAQSDS